MLFSTPYNGYTMVMFLLVFYYIKQEMDVKVDRIVFFTQFVKYIRQTYNSALVLIIMYSLQSKYH